MSFGGLTSFAKNALLTAQKHIDSALHIEEEMEDEEEEETENDAITTNAEEVHGSSSLYESAILSQNQHREIELSAQKRKNNRRAQDDDLEDVDLYGPSPPQSQWGEESSSKNQDVVDTEPNPIRDGHEPTNIYHFSPSSHSPDDDEQSSQNGQTSSATAQHNSDADADVTLAILDKTKEQNDEIDKIMLPERQDFNRNASEKTLDRFEEIRTTASSDIEVLRQMDDWSITSSQYQNDRQNQPKIPGVNLKEMLKPETLITSATQLTRKQSDPNDQSPQEPAEQIAVLMAKLKHRDQRIEELGRLNDNLKATSTNLAAKNKQKTAAETKMQSQLAEKEKQLDDLLGEGKKLSEYSGRQAKEIRKLKEQLTQLEVVTAARDSAIEELQDAHQQIHEQDHELDKLKGEAEKAEKRAEQLKTELEKAQNNSGGLEKQLCEQITQLKNANAELKRLEKEAKAAAREREELVKENRQLSAKLMNKTVQERIEDERERGLLEDLNGERAKCAAANARIREFEQRIESMQDVKRDIALEIANANSPLLNTIEKLEENLRTLERQNEALARQLRQANDQMAEQKRKCEMEMDLMSKDLKEDRQNGEQRAEELRRALAERAELQSRLKKSEEAAGATQKMHLARLERLEHQLEDAQSELKGKRAEIAELQRRNKEMQQKAAMARREKQPNGPLFPAKNQHPSSPIVQPIRSDPPGGVRAEFQQQMEMRQAQKATTIFPQNLSASSPTPSQQVRIDIGVPANAMDYSLVSADHLRVELDAAQGQLFQLRERFDHLLELYGGCLESIEEIKEDNEDLRKLCKEQALKISELSNSNLLGPSLATSSPCPAVEEFEEQ